MPRGAPSNSPRPDPLSAGWSGRGLLCRSRYPVTTTRHVQHMNPRGWSAITVPQVWQCGCAATSRSAVGESLSGLILPAVYPLRVVLQGTEHGGVHGEVDDRDENDDADDPADDYSPVHTHGAYRGASVRVYAAVCPRRITISRPTG